MTPASFEDSATVIFFSPTGWANCSEASVCSERTHDPESVDSYGKIGATSLAVDFDHLTGVMRPGSGW